MKNPFKIWLPLTAALMFGLGMLLQYTLQQPKPLTPKEKEVKNVVSKYEDIVKLIQEKYVDEITLDSLFELSVPALLSSLDPHSVYIPADEREDLDNELAGSFGGVGIEFRIENDKIVIAHVISGGPSEKVGIKAGDRIIEINGENVADVGIDEEGVRTRLRGQKDTVVSVKIERDGVKNPITFDIMRGDVPVTSVDAAYMIDDRIGYMKVNRFSRNTYPEFLQALAGLVTSGARDYILDLRGNGGGYMEPAIHIANEFLPGGLIIVSTHGRDANLDETVVSDGMGGLQQARLIVLVDELTASASEILSGAIQDNDRGLIMGRRTFGKGLVQQPIVLNDGSEIRLTVQRYLTPSGRSIQKDYTPGQNQEYMDEIFDRYRSGELQAIDSTKINRELIYKSLSGRELYGGGGILPDTFIKTDTIAPNSYLVEILKNDLIQKFSTKYVSENRPTLMKARDIESLLSMLPNDYELLEQFGNYGQQNQVKKRPYYLHTDKESSEFILTRIKALITYDILGRNAYYQIINTIDNNIEEAIKALQSGKADFPLLPS